MGGKRYSLEESNMKIGILFPGQGSQHVGMGQDLYNSSEAVRKKFKEADQLLGYNLTDIILNGPTEELTLTKHAQPSIFLVSIAFLMTLQEMGIQAQVFAGHSLGELTAYHAANVLSFEDTLTLIKIRGEEMNRASQKTASSMAAIMKLSPEKIQSVINPLANAPVVIANYNCPGQTVISGEKKALSEACDLLKQAGARVIPLPVSGAFHSPLMAPAKTALEKKLKAYTLSDASTPIVLNRTAEETLSSHSLTKNLPEQVTSPVRWTDSIQAISNRQVDLLIECGPGKVLAGLAKKITSSIDTIISINSLESLEKARHIVLSKKES